MDRVQLRAISIIGDRIEKRRGWRTSELAIVGTKHAVSIVGTPDEIREAVKRIARAAGLTVSEHETKE